MNIIKNTSLDSCKFLQNYSAVSKDMVTRPALSMQALQFLEKPYPLHTSYSNLFDILKFKQNFPVVSPTLLDSVFKASQLNSILQHSEFSKIFDNINKTISLQGMCLNDYLPEMSNKSFVISPELISSAMRISKIHAETYTALGKEISRIFQHDSYIKSIVPDLIENPNILDLQKLSKIFSSLDWASAYQASEDLEINDDSSVSLALENVDINEVQELVVEITNSLLLKSNQELNASLERVVSSINSLQSSVIEKAMTLVLFPILISIIMSAINPVADFYIKEFLGSVGKKTEKAIKDRLKETVDSETLKNYRIVVKKSLDIKAKPYAKSGTLATLFFGQPVILLERGKDWSLVLWRTDDDVMVQGWVFSRYLVKVK